MGKIGIWRLDRIPIFLLLAGLVVLLLRTAWVCDDAYISFTHTANFWAGEGLTYQPGERLQAFSNPLWTLLVGMLYGITGESWYTSMFLGMTLTFAAALLLLRPWTDNGMRPWLLGLALLVSSAFVDFGTSGLENSLSYLLVVLFAAEFYRGTADRKMLLRLCLLAGLGMLNRFDLGILMLPACAWTYFQVRESGRLGQVVLGFLPLLLWLGFALVYYGFLLPNTWHAKLGTGDGRAFLMWQGFVYLKDTLLHDPVTVLGIVVGLGLGVWKGGRKGQLICLGIGLYLLAVMAAGGDFMRGRMFAVPFVMALAVLGRQAWPRHWARVAFPALLVLGLWRADSPVWSGGDYHVGRSETPETMYPDNITDERALYFKRTGLWAAHGESEHPMLKMEREARINRDLRKTYKGKKKVVLQYAAGFTGYAAKPGQILLDVNALADPLLARMPAIETYWWRAGHYPRMIPGGYPQYLEGVEGDFEEEGLKAYVQQLHLVTRGDVWSGARWKAIGKFLFGQQGKDVNWKRFRSAAFKYKSRPEKRWYPSFSWRPVLVYWNEMQYMDTLKFTSRSKGPIRIEMISGGFPYGHLHVPYDSSAEQSHAVPLPEAIQERGFDEIWFFPVATSYRLEILGI